MSIGDTRQLSDQYLLSTSGKSQIIASTEASASVPDKEKIKRGLNIQAKPWKGQMAIFDSVSGRNEPR